VPHGSSWARTVAAVSAAIAADASCPVDIVRGDAVEEDIVTVLPKPS